MKIPKRIFTAILLLIAFLISLSCGSASNSEAQGEAKKYWLSKITKCGDSYYRREHFGDSTPTPGKDVYYELREPDVNVTHYGITEADKLNGLEWTGTIYLTAKVSRSIGDKEPTNQWTEWANGPGLEGDMSASMKKEKGQWIVKNEFEEQHTKTGIEYAPVDCSRIPK